MSPAPGSRVAELTSKVCIVGDFAVGKTSTVERFVNQQFSTKYLTTVGVKIDTKEIELPERNITQKLVLWDVAGSDRFGETEFAYLRGAGGIVYVADGTRSPTIEVANTLCRQIETKQGPLPSVFLLNKNDLKADWEITAKAEEALRDQVTNLYVTSAKTGDAVDKALKKLACMIADEALQSGG